MRGSYRRDFYCGVLLPGRSLTLKHARQPRSSIARLRIPEDIRVAKLVCRGGPVAIDRRGDHATEVKKSIQS
jgi:hypothetical protein